MNEKPESWMIKVKKIISEPVKMIHYLRNLFFFLVGIWGLFAFFNVGKILENAPGLASASWIVSMMV